MFKFIFFKYLSWPKWSLPTINRISNNNFAIITHKNFFKIKIFFENWRFYKSFCKANFSKFWHFLALEPAMILALIVRLHLIKFILYLKRSFGQLKTSFKKKFEHLVVENFLSENVHFSQYVKNDFFRKIKKKHR